jgi:hypothetical protein
MSTEIGNQSDCQKNLHGDEQALHLVIILQPQNVRKRISPRWGIGKSAKQELGFAFSLSRRGRKLFSFRDPSQ